jgi:hypothetical protein
MSEVGRVTDLSQESPTQPARIDRLKARWGEREVEFISQGGRGIRDPLVALLYVCAMVVGFMVPALVVRRIGCGPTAALVVGAVFAAAAFLVFVLVQRDGASKARTEGSTS